MYSPAYLILLFSKRRTRHQPFTSKSSHVPLPLIPCPRSQLTDGKVRRPSVITRALQGEVEVTTEGGTGAARAVDPATGAPVDLRERAPFFMLALDLPQTPLYKDQFERLIIPQVPLFTLLKKYDGESVTDDVRMGESESRVRVQTEDASIGILSAIAFLCELPCQYPV